jgi:hypothetical protein
MPTDAERRQTLAAYGLLNTYGEWNTLLDTMSRAERRDNIAHRMRLTGYARRYMQDCRSLLRDLEALRSGPTLTVGTLLLEHRILAQVSHCIVSAGRLIRRALVERVLGHAQILADNGLLTYRYEQQDMILAMREWIVLKENTMEITGRHRRMGVVIQ